MNLYPCTQTHTNKPWKNEWLQVSPNCDFSFNYRLLGIKTETPSTISTSASTPQSVSNVVHYLALALFQIEQGIERRFLKAPLGEYLLISKCQLDFK